MDPRPQRVAGSSRGDAMTFIAKLFTLQGKVALVTGGAGHLGNAMSRALAEAGADIVVASRDEARCKAAARALGKAVPAVTAVGLRADLSRREGARDLMQDVKERFGQLDVLVNNAYYGAAAPLERMSDDEWAVGLDGAVGAAFRCTVEALPLLRASRGASVINVASMYGLVSPDPGLYAKQPEQANPPNYGAGKAALLQLTRYCAVHLAKDAIRVNALTPGAFPEDPKPAFAKALKAKTPLGRTGRPEDLQGAIVFLASPASSFMTGANLVVDGGWTTW